MMRSHPRHPSPASGTWTTRDTQNGAQCPQWGRAVAPWIPAGMLTGASRSHFHPATGTMGPRERFPTFPLPAKGWGSWEPSSPQTQMRHPQPRVHQAAGVTRCPRAPRGSREGRSHAGAALAAPRRSLPCWKRDRQNTQRCPRRPRGAPSRGGQVAPGPACPDPPSPAPVTFFLLRWEDRAGKGVGQPRHRVRCCRGIMPQRHPLSPAREQGPRVARGGERWVMPELEQGSGGGWDSGRLWRADLGDVMGMGVHGTGAPGCPATQAGVGEGKENEAQRGLSSCHLMWEGCDVGTDSSTVGGGTASHPLLPPSRPPQSGDAEGGPWGWVHPMGRGQVRAGAQPRSTPASPTGSPSPAAAFPLPG